jgi:hypothetical protein
MKSTLDRSPDESTNPIAGDADGSDRSRAGNEAGATRNRRNPAS